MTPVKEWEDSVLVIIMKNEKTMKKNKNLLFGDLIELTKITLM